MSAASLQGVGPTPSSVNELSCLKAENASLKRQLDWFKRQLFGAKSERQLDPDPQQLALAGWTADPSNDSPSPQQTITYTRGKANKRRGADAVSDTGLRFDASVPMQTVTLPIPEIDGLGDGAFEVIDIQRTYQLAQRPASYVVVCYERPVIKLSTGRICQGVRPESVLDRSLADVSLLAGILVDKFCWHLPLYRQHQRMGAAGVTVARSSLTTWVQRSIALLAPIAQAQRRHIRQSQVLAMDETPIKVRGSPAREGKLKLGYYWPLYGDHDEVDFTYASDKRRDNIDRILGQTFTGTLLSDGNAAYEHYAAKQQGLTHAQCWAHTRRNFVEATGSDPKAAAQILALLGALYQEEKAIREQAMDAEATLAHRQTHSKALVDQIFVWAKAQREQVHRLPKDPFSQALRYLTDREVPLRVFLSDPAVAIDTNHLERAIRPVAMGKRSWLFCWTEAGAKQVGIIQSLIYTCRLQGIDPFTYLVDVLQRVGSHPNKQINQLTPRLWKDRFARDPLTSILDRASD